MKTVVPIPAVTPAKDKSVIGALRRSKMFRDYQRAFENLIGLKITMHTVEAWPLPRSPRANPLCALFGEKSCSCVCCRRAEERIATHASTARMLTAGGPCHCGVAAPLLLGRQLVGIVQLAEPAQDQSRVTSARRKGRDAKRSLLTPKQHTAALT